MKTTREQFDSDSPQGVRHDSAPWVSVAGCVVVAGLAFLCGWLIPAHLRAVEETVLKQAARNQPSLVDHGVDLKRTGNPDAAKLLLRAAQLENIPVTQEMAATAAQVSDDQFLFPGGPKLTGETPVTTEVVRLENRDRVFEYLQAADSSAVQELLRTRSLTNTVLFPASSSAAGQAFDAAVSVCGLLVAGNHLSPGLRDALVERAAAARTHADARPLEEILMDVMSLGQRFTLGQLVAFIGDINDPETLERLAAEARNAGTQLPELFAAVVVSDQPKSVAAYLNDYTQTGLKDLGESLRYGEGGTDELLLRHERLVSSPARERLERHGLVAPVLHGTARFAEGHPWSALALKWIFYFTAGFLLAAALHFAQMALAEMEPPLRVPRIHLAREFLFALGFLLAVLLLTEPFLAQESQKAQFAFRLRLPSVAAAVAGNLPTVKPKLMDTRSIITLLLFFVLQGLIYCACLVKLNEIRRQRVPARVQLKLLENEEHLFDAGLYLGFAGTIVCLILVSLGIIQQSLMAAYSSTSFGIIFVSVFKIFNLRPARRHLLMQAEAPTRVTDEAAPAAPTLITAE